MVTTGLDQVVQELPREWHWKRLGLLTNMAAVTTTDLTDAALALHRAGANLAVLFAPEHGFFADAPPGANVPDRHEPRLNIPVISLYGAQRAPTPEQLAGLDLLIVDLPDVGARFFTYASTMIETMRAAAQAEVPVVILDRPNPITGRFMEGPVLDLRFSSFVGMLPLPVRHGRTIGELALIASNMLEFDVDLDVVPIKGWNRGWWYDAWMPSWVPPSPNLPSGETALLYAGMGLIEGTNLSEGRGTPLPFHVVGAPWLDPFRLADELNAAGLPGVRFRPVTFTPTSHKYTGQTCYGVQVHVTARNEFRPVRTGLAIIALARAQNPARFQFIRTPNGGYWLDLLFGRSFPRQRLQEGVSWREIVDWMEWLDES
ncbi:MAG: DUF1343 domain-containing protein [Chloroflexi bacterium]|nr:DUF1343 domain-containing protein [Chloroflexota bacterium]